MQDIISDPVAITRLLSQSEPIMEFTGKDNPESHVYDPEDYYKKLDQNILNQPSLSLSA